VNDTIQRTDNRTTRTAERVDLDFNAAQRRSVDPIQVSVFQYGIQRVVPGSNGERASELGERTKKRSG
jgi:hypothetical protein